MYKPKNTIGQNTMNTKEHTYILEKRTAKNIAAIRKALNIIDRIVRSDNGKLNTDSIKPQKITQRKNNPK